MSKAKVTLSPNEISEKWNRRMKGSIPDIQRGIASVQESPMERAAANKEKMKNNLIKSVDNGKWEEGLRSVSLGDWKAKTSEKVATRMTGGVDAAMPKRQKFDNYLVNTVNAGLQEINNMPNMTLEDSIARSNAMIRHMANNPYKGK